MLERAHRMCLAQLRSHHDAEEAAALAVSWMWRYLGGYDSERHFELWFCRIVHNAVKHVVKTHARRLRQLDETQEAEVIADQLSPMEVLIERERPTPEEVARRLDKLESAMTKEQQTGFHGLRRGETYIAMAERLNINKHAAAARMLRAKYAAGWQAKEGAA